MQRTLIVLLAAGAIASSGCMAVFDTIGVTYNVKVGSMSKDLARAEKSTGKFANDMKKVRAEQQGVLKDLKAQGADMSAAPYPAYQEALKGLSAVVGKVMKSHARVVALRKRYGELTRGKKRLRSDSPEWAEVKTIREKAQAEMDQMQGLSDQANAAGAKLSSLAKKHRIGPTDVSALSKQLKEQLAAMGKQLQALQKNITSSEKRLQAMAGRMPEDQRAAKQALLDKMKQLGTQAGLKVSQIAVLVRSFEKARNGRKTMVVGPGATSDKLLTELQKVGQELQKIGGEINQLGQQLGK